MLIINLLSTVFALDYSQKFYIHPSQESALALAMVEKRLSLNNNDKAGKVSLDVKNVEKKHINLLIENIPLCYSSKSETLGSCDGAPTSIANLEGKRDGYLIKIASFDDVAAIISTHKCLAYIDGNLKMTPCGDNDNQIFYFEVAEGLSYCEKNPEKCVDQLKTDPSIGAGILATIQNSDGSESDRVSYIPPASMIENTAMPTFPQAPPVNRPLQSPIAQPNQPINNPSMPYANYMSRPNTPPYMSRLVGNTQSFTTNPSGIRQSNLLK